MKQNFKPSFKTYFGIIVLILLLELIKVWTLTLFFLNQIR